MGRVMGTIGLVFAGVVGGCAYFLLFFGPAVDRVYIHYVRTPVTATLTSCTPDIDLACDAEWFIDGTKHVGLVRRRYSGQPGTQIDAAVMDSDDVFEDTGLSTGNWVTLGFAAALPVLVAGALFLRRYRAARRGRQLPLLTVVLSPVITLGVVVLAAGLVLLAVGGNYYDGVEAGHGGLLGAVGVALFLSGIPVWWRAVRAAGVAAVARGAARAEARRAQAVPAQAWQAQAVSAQAWQAAAGPPVAWWSIEGALSSVVMDAMALAVREHPPGGPLTTGQFLAALVRTDSSADWQRIWLVTGDPERVGLATAPDPPDPGSGASMWWGVPLSERLAGALWVAGQVRDAYRYGAAPTGVIALGLLAYRGSGATEALLADTGITHAHLLRQVQTDIIGTMLPGLDRIIPAAA